MISKHVRFLLCFPMVSRIEICYEFLGETANFEVRQAAGVGYAAGTAKEASEGRPDGKKWRHILPGLMPLLQLLTYPAVAISWVKFRDFSIFLLIF